MNSSGARAASKRGRYIALGACAVLLIVFVGLSWSAWSGKSATFDEPLHFMGAWMQTHYDDYRCNPEDPPLWKFYAVGGTDKRDVRINWNTILWPRMLESIPAASVFFADFVLYQTSGNDADGLLRGARARMLGLGVMLGIAIAWWAWRLGGRVAAVIALAAFCLDPNFLAHSLLVKNDVSITLIFVVMMAGIFLLGQRATVVRLLSIVLLVAAAVTTKFSGILVFPIIAIALGIRAWIANPWPVLRWTLVTRFKRGVAAAIILAASLVFSCAFTWGCYGFRFGPSGDPSIHFDFTVPITLCGKNEMILRQDPVPVEPTNAELQQWLDQWRPSATVKLVNWANHHHLMPQAWLYGFLYTYGSSLARRSFLCGQHRLQGWWYYFPLAMLFKTPLATLVALALAAIVWFFLRRSREARDAWTTCSILVAPAAYFLFALHTNLNIGLRHIFPIYPFLFIFIGVTARRAIRRWPRRAGVVVAFLFAGLLIETLAAYPNFIPFFNVAAGGSRGGLALLSDSNMDWGQDLPALAAWQRAHPDRQLCLSQFASPDPRYYGIRYYELDGASLAQPDEPGPSGLPIVYAISAVSLQGTYITTQEQRTIYDRFRNMKPLEVLNGTIYLFDESGQ
jgi:hypothetical protein